MVLSVEESRFADDGRVPNNPALGLLIYRRPLDPGANPAGRLEEVFARNGWSGSWRDGIYGFHHFHSTAHEVLGIASGAAKVRFGGERGRTYELAAGDVVVIPAGVGHKNKGSSADLLVVGAYADGRDWDLCRVTQRASDALRSNIARVPLPATDPISGNTGPVIDLWHDGSRQP